MSVSGSGNRARRAIALWKVLAVIAVVAIAYYAIAGVVLPLFAPTPPPPGPAISLSPSTDIPGTTVMISGKELATNHTVTATYDNSSLVLSGSCRTDAKGNLTDCNFVVPRSPSGLHNVNLKDGTNSPSTVFTVPEFTPPISSALVALTSVGLSFVTQLVTLKFVDLDAERKAKAKVAAYNKEKLEASRAGDKAKLEKLKKRELEIRKAQSKISFGRLKVTGVTIVPLLVVYYLMASFLGGFNVAVVHSPAPIPLLVNADGNMVLFWWYILSSIASSSIISKLLRTTT